MVIWLGWISLLGQLLNKKEQEQARREQAEADAESNRKHIQTVWQDPVGGSNLGIVTRRTFPQPNETDTPTTEPPEPATKSDETPPRYNPPRN